MKKFIISIITLFTIFNVSNSNAEILGEDKYFVVSLTSDFSTIDRKRHTLTITLKEFNDLLTPDKIKNSAIQLAKNYYKQTNADVIEVFIKAPEDTFVAGDYLGKITIITDGLEQNFSKGPLVINVVKNMPTKKQIEIAKLYKKLADIEKSKGNEPNDSDIKKDIANKLNLKYTETNDLFNYIDIGMYYPEF